MSPTIHVVEKPEPIVSLEMARRHLADLPEEDEAYVEALILAATTWLDGPTGWLGRALGIQTLELSTADFYCGSDGNIPLPFCPVLDVVSIRYRDASGVYQTLPAEAYETDLGGVWAVSGAWPFVSGRNDNVIFRFKVGSARRDPVTGNFITDVPEPIRFAILLLVGHWYRNREAVVVGASVANLPFAVEALLQPYRIYR
ncbi:head-tail connector protein (plasmid) [Agrobacterium rosae]|uniref:Head-tail connector protein n=1 Tax=Agrobacterium rosae TaxID=1972867 RepID=A0ABU4W535_9HYPH|nr:head-tail connector protein [Agrobacterium rosae]MDX8332898.1 head-tail connector protein [Agrobacterium rosae]